MPRISFEMRADTHPLDRIDHQILGHLQKDARMSNKELAARIRLAPSTCLGRVQRLVEEGVIRGFHADVDPAAVGVLIVGSWLGLLWAQVLLAGTVLIIAAALAGMLAPVRLRPLRAVTFLVLSMAAVGSAWFSILKRDRAALWAPTERP